MTDIITSNVTLSPGDGWVLISPTSVGSFLRISHIPAHVPIYLTVADTLPTAHGLGFRVDCDSVHFDGGFTGNLYARIATTATAKVIVSIWQNPNAEGGGGGGSTTAVASSTAPTYSPGAQPLSQDLNGNLRIAGTITASTAATASATAPTYAPGSQPLSQDLSGNLRVTVSGGSGSTVVTQPTAANLNATVVGTGTLAVQNTSPIPTGTNSIGSISNTSFAATQATAANFNATVVGTGTLAVQNTASTPTGTNTIGKVGIDQSVPGTSNAVSVTNFPTSGSTTSSTSAPTQVSASATSVTILASNTSRLGATIVNNSSAIMYLLLNSGTATSSVYTVALAPLGSVGAYYEVPFNYIGAIHGVWATATGNAIVTEFTP